MARWRRESINVTQAQVRELVLDDGYKTPVHFHPPASSGPRRLPVLYLHGIQSHPDWFTGSAAHLATAGHPVYQVVRRGSGTNEIDRGHAESADQLFDDITSAIRMVASDYPRNKIHLLGVSWGGKLATAFACQARAVLELASLTLIAPGICPRVDVGIFTKLRIGLNLMVRPRRQFNIPLNRVALFTDNPVRREFLAGDSLRLHRATARFLYVSRQLDQELRIAREGCLAMPTTLLLAERDQIIDNTATEAVLRRLTHGRLSVRVFPAAHVLEFEPDPALFYQALLEALSAAERLQPLGGRV